ncbi:hypothetical protein [Acetobacter orleanensis]|uniref:hypothetical protein n=1 Tax=Acetobacter orleanensis TaxID=104099 RepID=UPI001427B49E|nr:hypothetical protein [Acetobacter orleanensis]
MTLLLRQLLAKSMMQQGAFGLPASLKNPVGLRPAGFLGAEKMKARVFRLSDHG